MVVLLAAIIDADHKSGVVGENESCDLITCEIVPSPIAKVSLAWSHLTRRRVPWDRNTNYGERVTENDRARGGDRKYR